MSRASAGYAILGAGALVAGMALAVGAQDPTPLPSVLALDVLEGGDPRSDGAGPGLAGSPLLILAAVIVLGIITAGVTIVLARVLQRD